MEEPWASGKFIIWKPSESSDEPGRIFAAGFGKSKKTDHSLCRVEERAPRVGSGGRGWCGVEEAMMAKKPALFSIPPYIHSIQ